MDRRLAVPLAVVVCVVLTVFVAGLVAGLPSERVLVVSDASTGEHLLTVPVEEGAPVTLAYTHSVERTPVEDRYVVRGSALDNVEMRFQSYGWGLPADANVTTRDGWFVFDPDRTYERVVVSPGEIAGHELRVDGTTYDLVALSSGRSVRLSVERRSVLPRLS
ncbi:DUF1850 domain-containing protein [Haloarchaeobius salinus]|uniref:DUF1850 domain-containing protein n=1 Tax=Haloarchaeobius salinus TaxID=1198298 RepID=UPI00210EA045|nr:DUF1850 domain-containing protein [Haloarchaeobius salinus]